MTLPNPQLFWIANSTKRRAVVLLIRASAARSAGRRPAKKTFVRTRHWRKGVMQQRPYRCASSPIELKWHGTREMQPLLQSRRSFLLAATTAAVGLSVKSAFGESQDLAGLTLKEASELLRTKRASPVELT